MYDEEPFLLSILLVSGIIYYYYYDINIIFVDKQ